MTYVRWQPIPASRVAIWQQEGRSELWLRMVHRLHGADAVDGHSLSIADAERLVDAALDEITRTPSGCAHTSEEPT